MSYVQFCSPFYQSATEEQVNWFPALDVSEEATQFNINVEVPGVKKEDVKLSFNSGIITIEGERKQEAETKEKNYHRVERNYGKFVRHLKLGNNVDSNNIKANYKDGVLNITVPKVEQPKPRSIDIHVE